jgi:putative peptidoglycan lipid II flippase
MSATSRNTLVTLSGNGLTLVLGLGVIMSVGQQFGVGRPMDAFWAANTLPNIVGQIFVSVSLLLLSPLFIRRRTEEGVEAAWEVGNTFVMGSVLTGLVAALLLWLAAPGLIRVLAPGFDSATSELASRLLRILAVSLPALAVAGTVAALLISDHRFLLSAFSRPLSLICVLIVLLMGSSRLGIRSYAYAVVMGSIASGVLVAVGLWPVRKYLRASWSWGSPGMKSLLSLLPFLLLARALDHGNQVATRAIASTLPMGAISAIGYAWTLFQIPGIVGASLGTVVYPQFSEKHARGQRGELVGQLARCCRLVLLISCPMGVVMLCLAQPLTQLLFERGLFHHEDTLLTAGVVAAYGVGVLATGINTLIGNLYWSLGLVRTRVLLEALAIVVCVLLALFLAPIMGPSGIALATSVMYVGLTVSGLVILMQSHLPAPEWSGLFRALLDILACGAGMALSVATLAFLLARVTSSPIMIFLAAGGPGTIVYVLLCRAMRRSDFDDLWISAKKSISRSRSETLGSSMIVSVEAKEDWVEAGR